ELTLHVRHCGQVLQPAGKRSIQRLHDVLCVIAYHYGGLSEGVKRGGHECAVLAWAGRRVGVVVVYLDEARGRLKMEVALLAERAVERPRFCHAAAALEFYMVAEEPAGASL